MNTNSKTNQLRNSTISEKSTTSRKASNPKQIQNLSSTQKKETNAPLHYNSQTNFASKSEKFMNNNNSNFLNQTINPNEEKIRDAIRSMFSESVLNRCLSKKGTNNTTTIISSLNPENTNRELKIKFSDTLRKTASYEDQIKNYLKKNFDNNYLCSLCWGLFKEPVTCYKCEATFCKDCLRVQLDNKGKCSSCFNIIFLDKAKFYENDDYEVLYAKTILNCVYYPVCKKMCNLFEIIEHMSTCVFKDSKLKYDEILVSKYNNTNLQAGNYNSIYNNEILENNEIFNFHKLCYEDKSQDPFLKPHLFDYLERLNKAKTTRSFGNISISVGQTEITVNNKKQNLAFNLENMKEFKSRLNQFNSVMNSLNNKIGDTIIDLANLTKISNDKMKGMINN
jgi:hypothetical protein